MFNLIRYANVWQDADILCEALAPSCRNGRILSMAGSGDNVLALLTLDPQQIVAADTNATQLAYLELKMEAFRQLDHPTLLAFLGVTASKNRVDIYQQLRKELSLETTVYWDSHLNFIERGLIHAGRFERYLNFFSSKILPCIHPKWKRDALLVPHSLSEQTSFFENQWNTWWWQSFFKIFFSRFAMRLLGIRSDRSLPERILKNTHHVMTQLPTYNNPYLVYALTGNFLPTALPRYLRPEFKEVITNRLNRITPFLGPIQKAQGDPFDGFNLSLLFESMGTKQFTTCYNDLLEKATPGARLAYWTKLISRGIPEQFDQRVGYLEQSSEALHFHDKAWFYQAFHVDEVKGAHAHPL